MQFVEIVDAVDHYKQELVNLGAILSYAKANYTTLVGEGINTWADFLKQPEIGLTVREANGLITLYDYIKAIGVPITELNLATVKFGASRGIVASDIVEDMKVLSLQDFKDRHFELNNPDKAKTYTYMVMRRCNETGNLNKVYGVEESEIIDVIKEKVEWMN